MTITNTPLEEMSSFFTARLDGYEEHMLEDGSEGYRKLAELVPDSTEKILDLGCGTGLELDEIFKRLPDVSVVGIDLTQAMLDRLKQKHPEKNIELICGNYFDVDFGGNVYDTAISYQTMHHFPPEAKVGLYTRIRRALKPQGVYIEADYTAGDQYAEDELYAKNAQLRQEMNIPPEALYHFDIPCTLENRLTMFRQAGFFSAFLVFRKEATMITVAKK